MSGRQFDSVWESMTSRRQARMPKRCIFAEALYEWAVAECAAALSSPTHISIAQTMLQLQKKYFEIRAAATTIHRYCVRPDANHVCLFHIYEEYFEQLLRLEWRLSPPQLYLPAPPPLPLPEPPPPPPPKYDGLVLGEIVQESED